MRGADPFGTRRTTLPVPAYVNILAPEGSPAPEPVSLPPASRFGDATASEIGTQQLERP